MSNEEDRRLFRETVGKVRRYRSELSSSRRQPPAPRLRPLEHHPRALPTDPLSDEYEPVVICPGENLEFRRSGIQERVFRKLRKGAFPIEAEIDLHGMTVPIARQSLLEFLELAYLRGIRCIRIIHGKGYSSRHQLPILKNKVSNWLMQLNEVLAFCSAQPRDGGTGAAYVLLRARR
ncbi:MAG TPA: DNA mismatch repair protein MutS [Chromatiaceae bacterium]|jgi:DNA-nicking Smr family endonuclease|nr:DNA mismatch repair protein MutS [Chromatiaceae bacterium]